MKSWRLVMGALVIAIAMTGCGDDDDGMTMTDAGSTDAGGGGTDAGGGGDTDAGGGGDTDAGGGGDTDAGGGGDTDAGMADAGGGDGGVSFGDDVWPIIQANCLGGSCHGGGAGGLAMPNAAAAYGNLVNVSSSCMGRDRVEPGSSGTSQMYLKLLSSVDCGSRMPLGRTPLDPAELATISDWIDEGAENN